MSNSQSQTSDIFSDMDFEFENFTDFTGYEDFSPNEDSLSTLLNGDSSCKKVCELPEKIKNSFPLIIKDNFGSKGVCTATEKAGKQFKIFLQNSELINSTLLLEKYCIFSKTQWPGTDGVEWLNDETCDKLGQTYQIKEDDSYHVKIEVIGIPFDETNPIKTIEKCTSNLCRSSKTVNPEEALPLCFFSKKRAKAIKFNATTPFIPIGFRCCPSYHDCSYFKLKITLQNNSGTIFYGEHPVHFLQSKTKERKQVQPHSRTENESTRPAKRPRSESHSSPSFSSTPFPKISNSSISLSSPIVTFISSLQPPNGPSAGGTWLTIEGSGFSETSTICFSHWNVPVETFRLNGSFNKLVCQTPPGQPGQSVQVFVVDREIKSNELIFTYDGCEQLQKSMTKIQNILENAQKSGLWGSSSNSSSSQSLASTLSTKLGNFGNQYSNYKKQPIENDSHGFLQVICSLLQTLLLFSKFGGGENNTTSPVFNGNESRQNISNGNEEEHEAWFSSDTNFIPNDPPKSPAEEEINLRSPPQFMNFDVLSQVSQVLSDLSSINFFGGTPTKVDTSPGCCHNYEEHTMFNDFIQPTSNEGINQSLQKNMFSQDDKIVQPSNVYNQDYMDASLQLNESKQQFASIPFISNNPDQPSSQNGFTILGHNHTSLAVPLDQWNQNLPTFEDQQSNKLQFDGSNVLQQSLLGELQEKEQIQTSLEDSQKQTFQSPQLFQPFQKDFTIQPQGKQQDSRKPTNQDSALFSFLDSSALPLFQTSMDLGKREQSTQIIQDKEGQKLDCDPPEQNKQRRNNGVSAPLISGDKIRINSLIGSGQYGVVLKGTFDTNTVAVKVWKSNVPMETVSQEIQIMSKLLSHRNVIKLFGIVPIHRAIVMEHMSKGDLKSFLTTLTSSPSLQLVLKISRDICLGMHFLHSNFIIHRDLAARNILIEPNKENSSEFTFKISDFGRSFILEEDEVFVDSSKNGPLRWMAPECLSRREFSPKSDIWSFAVILYEIFSCGSDPYSNMSPREAASQVIVGLKPYLPSESPSLFVDIAKKCTETCPDNRPHFLQILNLISPCLESENKTNGPVNNNDTEASSKSSNDFLFSCSSFNLQDILISDEIGKGCEGRVFKGKYNNEDIVIKSLNRNVNAVATVNHLNNFANAIKFNDYFTHFRGWIQMEHNTHLVYNKLPPNYISLEKFFETDTLIFADTIFQIFIQVLKGLASIHEQNIIHGNLRPSNIFFTQDFGGIKIKLGDFGVTFADHSAWVEGRRVLYSAPEVYLEGEINEKIDIYSFGFCIYQLLSKKVKKDQPQLFPNEVFENENNWTKIRDKIIAGQRPSLDFVFSLSNDPLLFFIANLIKECWKNDSHARPSAWDILNECNKFSNF